jgi:hypothetical protein
MKLGRLVAGVLAAALSACGPAPPSTPQPDWVLPSQKSQPLIWAADVYDTYAYTITGQVAVELKGFFDAVAVCTDRLGDLFVADDSRQVIFKYTPGSFLPIDVFDDQGAEASSCAIDPTTGSLAVANSSNVLIYPAGTSGTPIAYTNPNIATYACLAYDTAGNLFVDGYGKDTGFQLAELKKSGDSLKTTRIPALNNRKHGAGGIAWDGQYLAVADPFNKALYRIKLSDGSGTVAHASVIRGWRTKDPVQFALWGRKLLFPLDKKLLILPYPPTGRSKTGFDGRLNHVIAIEASS